MFLLYCPSSFLCFLSTPFNPGLCLSFSPPPASSSHPPGSEGEEFHPLKDWGEHQEEGAGVKRGVQSQRCSAAAHRQQQKERGAAQHAGTTAGSHHATCCACYQLLGFSQLNPLLCLPLCFQAIKESATELLFGGHETTASTATSLIMFLGLNPEAVARVRQELMNKVIAGICKLAALTG